MCVHTYICTHTLKYSGIPILHQPVNIHPFISKKKKQAESRKKQLVAYDKAVLTRQVQHQQIFLLSAGSSQRCRVSTEGQELQK